MATDTLYIEFAAKPSVESREVSPGVVIDYAADGAGVGIDVDEASLKLDVTEMIWSRLPAHSPKLPV
ncbi:MAG TPA: DUF2283 domain-containing protein [Candidatus Krumholzibacteria bacterium]|nr:DUF2283 domain-containing protein [Candidatus Krumholzibacteria bacterium]